MSRIHKARWALLAVSLLLGALNAWSGRFILNPDAICYLDAGDDLMRGDFWSFINAHWSPVYPMILGVALWLVRPPMEQELAVAHAVNYFTFVYALVCFDAFCRQLLFHRRRWIQASSPAPDDDALDAQDCWLTLGFFVLFWWATMRQLRVLDILADHLLMGSMFLCLAVFLRIWNRPGAGWSWSIILGLCLGFGYLCKAVFFPLAWLLIVAAAFPPGGDWRRVGLPRAALTLAAFLLVACPWVACLHYKYGRLTFSDSGRLNVIWWVNRSLPPFDVAWTDPSLGKPDHGLRPILDQPLVYEFDQPISGAYPPFKDPAWWLSGARTRFDPAGHLRQFRHEVRKLLEIAFHPLFLCTVCLMIAIAVDQRNRGKIQRPALRSPAFRATWLLTLYSAAGLLMYSILIVSPNYVAVFLLILPAAWLCGFTLVFPAVMPERLRAIATTMTIVFTVAFLPGLARDVRESLPPALAADGSEPRSFNSRSYDRVRVAQELREHGLRPGVRVALLGDWTHWARLCRVHIVAEVPNRQLFAIDNLPRFQLVLDALRQAGAEYAVVTVDKVPVTGYGGTTLAADANLRLIDLRTRIGDRR